MEGRLMFNRQIGEKNETFQKGEIQIIGRVMRCEFSLGTSRLVHD